MFFEIFKVYWFFQRLLQLQLLTSKNAYILHLLFFAFQSIIILYIYTNFTACICIIWRHFVASKITKNRVFATKPRMWFRPLILWFRGNRNDYGVWTEKIVYFSILRLFHAFLMQWFWCFLYGFCSIFSGYGVFRLLSGCNFFVLFTFTVNNFILYANSTEISGFSVLLCFWRLSVLT